MIQIMTATQHTSAAFTIPARIGPELTRYTSLLGYGHPGSGRWDLEVETPADEDGNQHWVSLAGTGGVSFESDGEQFFYCSRGLTYRVRRTTGSAVGLRIWLADVWEIVTPGVS